MVGGVAGEHVGEPGLDTHADQREQPALAPTRRDAANCSSPSIRRAARTAAPGAAPTASSPCRGSCSRRRTRPSKIGGLRRGSHAFTITSARSWRASSAIAAASDASSRANPPRAPSGAAARSARPASMSARTNRSKNSRRAATAAAAAPTPPAPTTRTRNDVQRVCGKPRSTREVAGSGQRLVTTLLRV